MNQKIIDTAYAHAKTWTHILSQIGQLDKLCLRTLDWEKEIKTVEAMIVSIKSAYLSSYKMMSSTASQFKKMAPEMSDSNLGPLGDYLDEMAANHSRFAELMESQYLARIESFGVLKKAKQFRSTLKNEQIAIATARAKILSAIKDHLQLKAEFKSNVYTGQVDPWLRERVLFRDIKLLVEQENEFQARILLVKREMLQFEGQFTQFLSMFYRNLFDASGIRALSESSKCLNTLLALHDNDAFEKYWKPNGLENDEMWTRKQTTATCSLVENPFKVVKEGLLLRPAKFRKAWKLSLFVLTDTGYLHCFKTTKTVTRKKSVASLKQGSSATLTEEAAVYDELEKPEAFYSVTLNKPKTDVRMVQDPSNLNVLQVGVMDASGLFSMFKETSFLIKFNNEQEMIEWAALLKNQIEFVLFNSSSFIDQEPPKPLFKSAERVESEIQDLMKQTSAATLAERIPVQTDSFAGKSAPLSPVVQETII